jgi:hypothetical protein
MRALDHAPEVSVRKGVEQRFGFGDAQLATEIDASAQVALEHETSS